MAEESVSFQLSEPISPESLVPKDDPVITAWVVAISVLLLGLAVIWLVARKGRKNKPGTGAVARRLRAYQKAHSDLSRVSAEGPREAATQVSLILRQYFADAFEDPSLFETHEEFVSRKNSLSALESSVRTHVAAHFAYLAQLKYSPEISPQNPQAIVTESRALLETLREAVQP